MGRCLSIFGGVWGGGGAFRVWGVQFRLVSGDPRPTHRSEGRWTAASTGAGARPGPVATAGLAFAPAPARPGPSRLVSESACGPCLSGVARPRGRRRAVAGASDPRPAGPTRLAASRRHAQINHPTRAAADSDRGRFRCWRCAPGRRPSKRSNMKRSSRLRVRDRPDLGFQETAAAAAQVDQVPVRPWQKG